MKDSHLNNTITWLDQGGWMFLGMSAYGPTYWCYVAAGCWFSAFLLGRYGYKDRS